jgi:hypothetical protein
MCSGHCTVQCPVHRQPRAKIPFSCAMFGGSPDSYCALSGVHWTCTVDCPVHPYRVLKNGLQPETEPEALFSLCALCSLFSANCSLSPAISPHRRPLCSGDLQLLRPSLLPLVSSLVFSSLLSLFMPPVKHPSSTPCESIQISCEIQ